MYHSFRQGYYAYLVLNSAEVIEEALKLDRSATLGLQIALAKANARDGEPLQIPNYTTMSPSDIFVSLHSKCIENRISDEKNRKYSPMREHDHSLVRRSLVEQGGRSKDHIIYTELPLPAEGLVKRPSIYSA